MWTWRWAKDMGNSNILIIARGRILESYDRLKNIDTRHILSIYIGFMTLKHPIYGGEGEMQTVEIRPCGLLIMFMYRNGWKVKNLTYI